MRKFYTIITALVICIVTNTFAQQTLFHLNGNKFMADTAFYNYANVIRCAKPISSEETPAAICCKYSSNNMPAKYYYTGENYTCPRINGKLGTLSYNCIVDKQQLRSANNYANAGLTIQSMIAFCKHKP